MRALIFFASLAAFNAALGETVPPESVGMSSKRLNEIGPLVERSIEAKNIAGAVTLVARRGSIVHLQAHGTFSVPGDRKMTTDAIFGLASLTKPIVHVAAMMLVEDGKLLLDDPVSRYLPDFGDAKVKLPSGELVLAKEPIRIHHLLRHTSGFPEGEKSRSEFSSIDDYKRYRAEQPLLFHPGERYHYPESTEALGWVIEEVSQESLRQFLKERIFDPLGMDDTDFGIPKEKKGREAFMMTKNGTTDSTRGGRSPDGVGISDYFDARGGLYSTAEDYWKFCQMLLNHGEFRGKRLLSQTNVQRMLATKSAPYELPGWRGTDQQMTLGFRVFVKPSESDKPFSKGTFAKGGASGTHFFVDPREELICIRMVQTRRGSGLGSEFLKIVYSAITD